MWEVIGATVGSALLNALGGQAENAEMDKRRQRALSLLRENIIDPGELDLMLNNINRLFNNRLANTLNSTALSARGVANSNVVKGAVAGTLEGQRYQALIGAQERVYESNKGTLAQMAQTELAGGPNRSFFMDFATGGLKGAQLGMEWEKMNKDRSIFVINPGKEEETETTPSASPLIETKLNNNDFNSPMSNPFLRKLKIEDEDIYNFNSGYKKFFR